MKDELAWMYTESKPICGQPGIRERAHRTGPFGGGGRREEASPVDLPLFLSLTLPSITLTLLLVCTLRGDLKALLFPPLKNHSNQRGSSQACIFEEQPALPVVSFLLSP